MTPSDYTAAIRLRDNPDWIVTTTCDHIRLTPGTRLRRKYGYAESANFLLLSVPEALAFIRGVSAAEFAQEQRRRKRRLKRTHVT